MPQIPEMTATQKLVAAARILDTAGYSLDVAGHITIRQSDGAACCCAIVVVLLDVHHKT